MARGATGLPSEPTTTVLPPHPPVAVTTQPPVNARRCPNCGDLNPPGDPFCELCGCDFTTGQLPGRPRAGTGPGSGPVSSPPLRRSLTGAEWLVEQWVDQAWYAVNGVDHDEPCPPPGVPATFPLLTERALIGRKSNSRGISPEVDCTADVGVSRRQAQLTFIHNRWYVEDLGSTNGTHIGKNPGPIQPIPPGKRCLLAPDDRIYIGAWTRLVVRPTTTFERS